MDLTGEVDAKSSKQRLSDERLIEFACVMGWMFAGAVILAQIAFLFRQSAWWCPWIAMIFAAAAFMRRSDGPGALLGLIVAFVVVAIAVSSVSFETSWDGMYYHKNVVIALADGWSALYERHWENWGQVYPLGHWIWDAAFYRLLGDIRFAHATNVLIILVAGAGILGIARRWLPSKLAIAVAILVALNLDFSFETLTASHNSGRLWH